MWGMIWVEGLHYSPMAFLIMTAAFRSMDSSLEESAMMSGASIAQIAWRITLKLTCPAIFATFLILCVRAIESFEVPALIGLPVGIQVFTSLIYQAIHQYPSKIGLASSYAVTLLLITTIGIYFQSRLSSQGSRYSTVTGKGSRPRAMDLGKWRSLTACGIAVFGLGLVIAAEVLQRTVDGGAAESDLRCLSLHVQLPDLDDIGLEQSVAGAGQRHHRRVRWSRRLAARD